MSVLIPKKEQLDFLSWEVGMFFHFGIRTFYSGHVDWDGKPMGLAAFNPVKLSCDNWIQAAVNAGARYAILVAKHHDGFANWPSKYTDYSIANTPYKDGKGDVVKEFTDACRKAGLKSGLYYSPADADLHAGKKTLQEHNDFFINQISELLTNYGKIDYLWFDGCGSEDVEYDKPRIIRAIRTLQPGILIFNMWDPDTRWVGNEDGYAEMPNYNVTDQVDFSVLAEEKEKWEQARFAPAECDFRIRRKDWFYNAYDPGTVKSVEELMGIYYHSVGRGANMLINLGPNPDGLIETEEFDRVTAFGQEVRRRFDAPLFAGELFVRNDPEDGKGIQYVFRKEELFTCSHVVLQENLKEGEKIKGFALYMRTTSNQLILLYSGKNVGHKAICAFPAVMTKELIVEITETFCDGAEIETISIF